MAVYTEISDEDLRTFVSEYSIGEVTSYKGIAEGVENSNYLLKTTCGDFILTLYEKRVDPTDLPFFISLMDFLAEQKFPAPIPIHDKNGVALNQLSGKPAAICTFLDGMWPKVITPEHCKQLGKTAAKLHIATRHFSLSRKNSLSLEGWSNLAEATLSRADEIQPQLANAIERELQYLNDTWPVDLPAGIIHADMFPDNVFFKNGQISGLIDFYFACQDTLAYDLAICINAWCFDIDCNYRPDCGAALIDGYNAERTLSHKEIQALPILCRGASIRFLLTRLYDFLNQIPGALVKPKNPLDYFLRLSFHQKITKTEQYRRLYQ
ncbi:MAG: homoserine kinase [Rhodospirillaceae bacterium]